MLGNIQIKETKSGKLAVILPKTEASIQFIQRLIPFSFALPGPKAASEDTEYLAFKQATEARQKKATEYTLKPVLAIEPQKRKHTDEYNYEALTEKQRSVADLALDIRDEIARYASLTGRTDNESKHGNLYTTFYTIMRREHRYYPSKKSTISYLGRFVPTRINTVLNDGKGRELLTIIRRENRVLEARLRRGLQ